MGKSGLGEFELIVLLAALRLGDERAHTLAIVDEIVERTARKTTRSAVYVTLQRLEKKGLVTSWLSEPRAERGGKRRRHVTVEAAGQSAVRRARAALESLWQDLEVTAVGGPR
ncbi:MAG: helix-turn-helix transcriptional regulator [Acidobacteriota bacterium]